MKAYAALLLLSSCAFAAPHIQEDLDLPVSDQQHVLGGFNPTGNPAVVQHHIPGPPVFKTNLTIYETLAADPDYSKLVRLINFDKEFADFLNNTETTNITFFAVNNRGLTPPKRKHPHHGGGLANILEDFEVLDSSVTDDGDDDEEKKKWLRKLLHALLEYHSLQVPLSKYQLSLNSTYATGLQAADGSFDGQQRRVAVTSGFGPLGPLKVNFYATILPHGFDTSNGFLYTITRPLFPPPSILDELFLTKRFSTTTSALQKVGIDNWLQWRWKKKDDSKSDTTGSVVTFFAPTEEAWDKLPYKLRRYLFSPFGEKALKKVLSYHIVPDYIVHSDWFHNATKSDDFVPVEGDFSTEGLHEAAVLEYGPRLTGLPCDGHKPEVIHETLFGDSARRRRRSKRCRAGPPLGFISSDEPPVPPTPPTPPNVPDIPDLPTPPKFPNPPPGTPDRDHPPPHWPFPPHKPTWSLTFNESIPTLLEDTPINIFVLKPNKSLDKEALDFVLEPLDTIGGGRHPPPPPPPHHDPHESGFPPFSRGVLIASHIPTSLEVPARNGVVYVVNRILRPGYRPPGAPGAPGSPPGPPPELDSHFDDVWNDWEDWLPA